MMATCKFCENEVTDTVLCNACRSKLGLVSGGGARSKLPCQRCNHPEHVRALARELTTSPGQSGEREAVPMSVTLEPIANRTFFMDRPDGVRPGTFTRVHGVLDMYVCRKCGFTEWYCRAPQSIPIGEEYGTEIVTSETDSPYR
jgi:rubrerythrin